MLNSIEYQVPGRDKDKSTASLHVFTEIRLQKLESYFISMINIFVNDTYIR